MKPKPTTSIIIPIYNEGLNLKTVYHKLLKHSIEAIPLVFQPVEIIFVDDGSNDDTPAIIKPILAEDDQVIYLKFKRNFGKTSALVAGFRASRGDFIVTMDGDGQDHPLNIVEMLNYISSNDLVCGWRVDRQRNDPLTKTVPSFIYNHIVRALTGIKLHDFNCGLKVYRREVVEKLRLYGEFHRFIPVLAMWYGFRVCEIKIDHFPRLAGQSKFGARRYLAGLLDFITVLFLTHYLTQPMRLFGSLGVLTLGLGSLINAYLAGLWVAGMAGLTQIAPIGTRPLLAVGILAVIFGLQLISIGLIGEMIRYYTFNPDQEYQLAEDTQ